MNRLSGGRKVYHDSYSKARMSAQQVHLEAVMAVFCRLKQDIDTPTGFERLMKELLVLRHAKSTHSNPRVADHDRPLNDRGLETAPRVGRLLAEQGLLPDLVLCSTARRTTETAALVTEAAGHEVHTEHLGELYLASAQTILELVVLGAGEADRVMVVGHNPGMEGVLSMLGLGMHEMPTAALAHVRFDIDDWIMATSTSCTSLENLWLARTLPD
jgi:phosphohistidine phosphatase